MIFQKLAILALLLPFPFCVSYPVGCTKGECKMSVISDQHLSLFLSEKCHSTTNCLQAGTDDPRQNVLCTAARAEADNRRATAEAHVAKQERDNMEKVLLHEGKPVASRFLIVEVPTHLRPSSTDNAIAQQNKRSEIQKLEEQHIGSIKGKIVRLPSVKFLSVEPEKIMTEKGKQYAAQLDQQLENQIKEPARLDPLTAINPYTIIDLALKKEAALATCTECWHNTNQYITKFELMDQRWNGIQILKILQRQEASEYKIGQVYAIEGTVSDAKFSPRAINFPGEENFILPAVIGELTIR